MTTELSFEEKLMAARVYLQNSIPFFYTIFSYMHLKISDIVPVAGVDINRNLYLNPAGLEKEDFKCIAGVLAHEALHDGFLHMMIGANHNHTILNIAQDLKVNQMVVDMGLPLPAGALIPIDNAYTFEGPAFDEKFEITDIDKKTFDEIYYEIMDHVITSPGAPISAQKGNGMSMDGPGDNGSAGKGNSESAGSGDGEENSEGAGSGLGVADGFDDHMYTSRGDMDEAEISRNRQQRMDTIAIAQEIHRSQNKGSLPGSIKSSIKAVLKPRVNWKNVLHAYLTNRLPYGLNWSRPHKRSYVTGVYFPKTRKSNIDVIVALDTSGSISSSDLSKFLGECIMLSNSFTRIKMEVLFADTEVHDHCSIDGNALTVLEKFHLSGGRGGTDHRCIQQWVEENSPNARVVVALTDGYTSFPESPTCDWLWVITPNGCSEKNIPYGKVIKLNEEGL